MTQHSDVSQPNALKPGQTIKPLPGADHDHAHEKGNSWRTEATRDHRTKTGQLVQAVPTGSLPAPIRLLLNADQRWYNPPRIGEEGSEPVRLLKACKE